MIFNKSDSQGFTIIEVMIALVINLILFAGLMAVFSKNIEHYQKTTSANRLYEQLDNAMEVMSSDIRRAGYWNSAANDIGLTQNNNPFMTNATNIQFGDSNHCILFSYDRDSNGVLSAISNLVDDERYGFRLNNGAIQARPRGSNFDCATNWENMTDTNVVTITDLTFTPSDTTLTSGTHSFVLRNIVITITGQLAHDASVTKTITQHVRIRNDKFVP